MLLIVGNCKISKIESQTHSTFWLQVMQNLRSRHGMTNHREQRKVPSDLANEPAIEHPFRTSVEFDYIERGAV